MKEMEDDTETDGDLLVALGLVRLVVRVDDVIGNDLALEIKCALDY